MIDTRAKAHQHSVIVDKVWHCILVFFVILLSKSLYYETYGNNVLLIGFLCFLAVFSFLKRSHSLTINIHVLLYFLCFGLLISLNGETKFSSVLVLLIRSLIALYIVSLITFEAFSHNYIRIIKFLCLCSLFSFFVILFDINSPLPNFFGLDGRPLRNFVFFGVSNNFVTYNVFRNSGIWWEPGAFQLFVNLAMLFALVTRRLDKRTFVLFAITIASTLSTSGVLVFMLLSSIYFRDKVRASKGSVFLPLFLLLFSILVSLIAVPFILSKFGGEDAASQSVSFLSRYYDFLISIELLKNSPYLGYGFGSQVENAIPAGINLFGVVEYELIGPTGADGITMFISQLGFLGFLFVVPILFPRYAENLDFLSRALIFLSLLILFNTQNFTFTLIFSVLTVFGISGSVNRHSVKDIKV